MNQKIEKLREQNEKDKAKLEQLQHSKEIIGKVTHLEKADKTEKPDKAEKVNKADKAEKSNKTNKTDK